MLLRNGGPPVRLGIIPFCLAIPPMWAKGVLEYRNSGGRNGINLTRFTLVQSHGIGAHTDTITPYPTGRVFGGGAVPGTSCQAAFADYGAPDSQGFAQPPSAVAT